MKHNPLISVIVTTYNWPNALTAVLDALFDQTDPQFEVIIADDGSKDSTRDAIAAFSNKAAAPGLQRLVHAWQPDEGFRASAVRNLGVRAAKGDYLIFLDGDCIPRPRFISNHRQLAEKGFLVSGSRVLLSEKFTHWVLSTPHKIYANGFLFWMRQRLFGNTNKVLPLLSFPDNPMRTYMSVKWNRIKSCNLAIWREDYEAVNGFDESFVGWGHEDADLVLRLARLGVKRKGGAFCTEVFHLWHKENTRSTESENRRRVEERIKSGLIRSERGLMDDARQDARIETILNRLHTSE